MFRLINFFLFLLIVISGSAQDIQKESRNDSIFSKDVMVSLLTFDAANEPHSVWGHTAIRIKDESQNIDLVFNYGAFDFDAPYFLIKFLRGKLDYAIAFNKYATIYRYYNEYKRGMYEQVLNLTYWEKVKLYKLLKENYKKENRYYKYDFFFDNCSTRPLEIIEKSIKGKLMLKKSGNQKTFRQLLTQQISNHQWMDFGIDLIIGARADKIPTPRQSAFLPFQLKKYFSSAKISVNPTINDVKSNRTVIKRLVKTEHPVFEYENTGIVLPAILLPIWVFTLFFLLEIVIFFLSYKKRKILYKWYDKTWFFLAFVSGLLITFLWFFTDHLATKDNWNYLWLNPLYLFVFLKKSKFKDYLIYIVTGLLFVTMIGFSFVPQEFHFAIIPILGLLFLKIVKYGVLKRYFNE